MQKILIKTFTVTLAAFLVFRIASAVLNTLGMDYIPRMFAAEVVLLAVGVIAAIITKKVGTMKFSLRGMGTGFVTGWWIWLSPTLAVLGSFGMDNIKKVTVSGTYILIFLVTMLIMGAAEELLFRGVLLNGCLDAWSEKDAASIRKAVVVAGCVFGACHVFNVFSGVALGGAVIHAICNIPSGILYGAIYIRCRKNIWPCIFLHAYVDMLGFISGNVLAGESPASMVSGYNHSQIIIAAIQLAIALFLMRSSKLDPLTSEE